MPSPAPPDPLAGYHARRDFTRTAEPAGAAVRASPHAPLAYFVQRHAARRLHYDLRLELDGVLKSWAVPKGPSLDPAARRLAVQVEDHPLDYGSFEGRIAPGQYGAGTVELWDRGTWIPEEDPHLGLARGHLHFILQGRRLAGAWLLVRSGADPRHWLLRKRADSAALAGHRAADQPSHPPAGLPVRIAPQLASPASSPPVGAGWAYEIKLDGYRLLARCAEDQVSLYTRNGHDWTARLPALASALSQLRLAGAWIDGEIAVTDAAGRTSFALLQTQLERMPATVRYHVFDVLFWQGSDVRDQPLTERWRRLDALFSRVPAVSPIVRSVPLAGDGTIALEEACRLGLEGLIGKRLAAPYRAGRNDAWLKLKCAHRQEFVIGGYSTGQGARQGLGALLLGARDAAGRLVCRGRVGSGFAATDLRQLRARLAALASPACPFASAPPAARGTVLHWVRPELVAEVRFAGTTEDGLLRHPVFLGVRADKAAAEVTAATETPARPPSRPDEPNRPNRPNQPNHPGAPGTPVGAGASTATRGGTRVAGVTLTHAQRVMASDPATSKLALARYYEAIAPVLLPLVAGRPLTLLRCPSGQAAPCFVQKHLADPLPAGLRRIAPDALALGTARGLIELVQRGVVELHTWGARLPRLDAPDLFVLDLDPDPALPWARVAEAAQLARVLVEELGFRPRLKTTGGKGLHLVVPLRRGRDWPAVKQFTQALARQLERVIPERFTASLAKSRRTGKIFVDYLRNAAGATAVAPYSVRARPGAPVATPLAWEELDPAADLRGDRFNVRNLPRRVRLEQPAPWGDWRADSRAITVEMTRRLGLS